MAFAETATATTPAAPHVAVNFDTADNSPSVCMTAATATLNYTPPAPTMCTPRSNCCKVCNKGKACGHSCISRSYTCGKGPGCACNASEVCR